MFKDLSVRIFLVHLAAFAAGIVICAAINLWLKPGTLWFPWVLLGWGVAVATHAVALLLRKTRRRERIFIDPKARASIVHLFAYIAVVLLLAFVNLTVTPKVWWFYWVALGWGVGVGFHLWCAFGKRRRRAPRPETSRQVEAKQSATEAKPPGKRAPRQRRPKA
jgi:O-antigen/teichoic acid export membrane protein